MKLPILSLGRPCPVRTTEDRDFYCSTCRQQVYALSRRSEQEALDVLQRPGGPPCVSYRTDRRGRVRFRGAVTAPLLGLALAAGCSVNRGQPTQAPEDAGGLVEVPERVHLGQGASIRHPYETEGVDSNRPSFGALTVTIIIDGRRRYFGVGG